MTHGEAIIRIIDELADDLAGACRLRTKVMLLANYYDGDTVGMVDAAKLSHLNTQFDLDLKLLMLDVSMKVLSADIIKTWKEGMEGR